MIFQKKEEQPKESSFQELLGEALFAVLEDGVIVYDTDFKIFQLNKAAEKILEVKAAEVAGKTFSLDKAKNFKSKIMAQAMFPSLAPAITRQSEPGRYPQVLDISLDEPRRDLRIITNQIADNLGQAVGFVKLIRDRTRELELAKAKSDFVTVAAHQLRTPATGISWALKNLVRDKNISGESKETLAAAYQAAQNLLEIINDLIDLTQLEEGKFAYQFKEINLIGFLEKVLSQADLVARESGIKLYFNPLADGEIIIKADAEKLGAAISNLIDNGIKYNVKNGEVTVDVQKRNGETEIIVKDTGIGMSKDDLSKLFVKFVRGKSAEKTGVGGSGLGLYLAKKIIEAHGGSVSVESIPDRGTTVFVRLPLN